MNRHPPELHTFALGDLSGAAAADVVRHVTGCTRCRREVQRLREDQADTVRALPTIAPSAEARERALAAARSVMAGSSSPPHPRSVRKRSQAPAWTGWVLAGIVAVTGIAVSSERHAAWRASDHERALVAAWLTRRDVTSWPLPAPPGERSPGTVMVADNSVVLIVMRAPAAAGSAYRAWGVGPDGQVALGDLSGTVLRVAAAGYDEVLVSLEPRGSAPGPTALLGVAPLPSETEPP